MSDQCEWIDDWERGVEDWEADVNRLYLSHPKAWMSEGKRRQLAEDLANGKVVWDEGVPVMVEVESEYLTGNCSAVRRYILSSLGYRAIGHSDPRPRGLPRNRVISRLVRIEQ